VFYFNYICIITKCTEIATFGALSAVSNITCITDIIASNCRNVYFCRTLLQTAAMWSYVTAEYSSVVCHRQHFVISVSGIKRFPFDICL